MSLKITSPCRSGWWNWGVVRFMDWLIIAPDFGWYLGWQDSQGILDPTERQAVRPPARSNRTVCWVIVTRASSQEMYPSTCPKVLGTAELGHCFEGSTRLWHTSGYLAHGGWNLVEPFISIACGAFIYAQFSSKYHPKKLTWINHYWMPNCSVP